MQDFSLPAALRSIAPIVKSLAQASSSNDWRNTLATVIGVPLSTSVPPIALCPLAALTASRQQRVTNLVASETLALVSCISQFTSDERLCTCDTANRLGKSLLLLVFSVHVLQTVLHWAAMSSPDAPYQFFSLP